MADPVKVSCPANVWTLVATGVTSGSIKKLNTKPNKYLETYRMTVGGGAAPTTDASEGVEVFTLINPGTISSSAAINVYIMPIGAAGKVRRDV